MNRISLVRQRYRKALPGMIVVLVFRTLRRAQFRLKTLGKVKHGANFIVGPRARVARGASLTAGNRVNIGADFSLQADVTMGDDVMISSGVAMIGNDHDFSDPNATIQEQGRRPRAHVYLEGDNLIGFNTIILGDVTVGHGTVVGAGSLVTHDLPPNQVCVGRPAAPIRQRR